jgi:cytochrome c oxidase subunit 2
MYKFAALRPRLGSILLVVIAALLVLAPEASADLLTPESGPSQNANDIDTLYKITLYIGLVIFLLVECVLIYSLIKFRARRDGPEPAQIRGNTPLEISWTIGAALILVLLATVTFVYLPGIKDPPNSKASPIEAAEGSDYATINQKEPPDGSALRISVNSQQYIWRYDYDDSKEQLFSFHTLYVPVGRTVTLKIYSSDVAHSWWVPKLAGKADAIPGYTNETWFRADEVGTYEGACAELCGEGHADMRTRVVVLPADEYEAWAEQQIADIKEAQTGLAEQRKEREATDQDAGEVTPEEEKQTTKEEEHPSPPPGEEAGP